MSAEVRSGVKVGCLSIVPDVSA